MGSKLSIVIPVLNESALIEPLLAHLSSLKSPEPVEMIVVDGDPGGGTVRAITRPGVQTLIAPRGRGVQLNAGARAASGDALLFLHADTRLPADALPKIMHTLAHREQVAGAFSLAIASNRRAFRLIERAVGVRSRITRIPYGDQALFLRRDLFFRAGGFRDLPLMEDVDLVRRVKKSGARIVILPDSVRTSPRRWLAEGILYCTLRNWLLMALYLAGVSPDRLLKYYRVHPNIS